MAYEFDWISTAIRYDPERAGDSPTADKMKIHGETLEGATRNGWEHVQTFLREEAVTDERRLMEIISLMRRPVQ